MNVGVAVFTLVAAIASAVSANEAVQTVHESQQLNEITISAGQPFLVMDNIHARSYNATDSLWNFSISNKGLRAADLVTIEATALVLTPEKVYVASVHRMDTWGNPLPPSQNFSYGAGIQDLPWTNMVVVLSGSDASTGVSLKPQVYYYDVTQDHIMPAFAYERPVLLAALAKSK